MWRRSLGMWKRLQNCYNEFMKKGFAQKILVIIAALIVGGGVFYFLMKSEKIAPTTQNPSASNSQATPSTTQDIAANWKAYHNEQYGFSFKYPSDYTIQDGKPNSITVGNWFVWIQNPNQQTVTVVNVFKSNLLLEAFAENEKQQMMAGGYSVDKDGQPATVNGLPALIYSYASSNQKNNGVSDIFYVKKGNVIYRIQLNWGDEKDFASQRTVQNIFNSVSLK